MCLEHPIVLNRLWSEKATAFNIPQVPIVYNELYLHKHPPYSGTSYPINMILFNI